MRGRLAVAGVILATALLASADPQYARFGRDELPVVLLSRHEANAYCRWFTRRLGGGRWLFRMPTEGEWEKAARAPDGFDYGLGMELSEPQSGLYNWRKNPGAAATLVGREETSRRYRPNRYGVYHASGNAREWTQSAFRHYNAERPPVPRVRPQRRRVAGDAGDPGRLLVQRERGAPAARVPEEFQPELSSDDLGFRIAAVLGAGSGGRE